MPCPGIDPCGPWELDLGCCLVSGSIPNPCLNDGTPVSQSIIDSSILVASQFLWAVTGRQFGMCTVDIRPCRACSDACCLPENGWAGFPAYPFHQADGSWVNLTCGCGNVCSCTNLSEITLPSPVCSVDEVIIDGEIVDPATYRVDDFRRLVRLGADVWPRCNDLTKGVTEEGTWQVTVTYGQPVPELVRVAATELACELIKRCLNKPCALPRNVTAVTRQGITEVFADPNQALINGLTGLYLVDLAIRSYNPNRLQRRPTVYSPDAANKWRRTTWQDEV